MMNWWSVAANALWIFAMAWGMAIFGISYWECLENKQALPIVLIQTKKRLSLTLALILFSIGLGLVTGQIWGKALWFALAIVCIFAVLRSLHLQHKIG